MLKLKKHKELIGLATSQPNTRSFHFSELLALQHISKDSCSLLHFPPWRVSLFVCLGNIQKQLSSFFHVNYIFSIIKLKNCVCFSIFQMLLLKQVLLNHIIFCTQYHAYFFLFIYLAISMYKNRYCPFFWQMYAPFVTKYFH